MKQKDRTEPDLFFVEGGDIKKTGQPPQRGFLLNIVLPTSPAASPHVPLTIGQHNACAQQNFTTVAQAIDMLIRHEKALGKKLVGLEDKINKLTEQIEKHLAKISKKNE